MNILLVNHYAGTPFHGMEFRPYYLAKEWVKTGHNVLIVAASYTHLRSKQFEVLGKRKIIIISNIKYLILSTPPYKNNNYSRILNILTFNFRLFRNRKFIASKFKPDIVISSSTYVFDIFFCKMIAKISGAKLVFEVHDLWPLSPIELGNYSKWHPYIMAMQIAENYAYKHCDKVISILPYTLEYMVLHGLDRKKFSFVPNGISTEDWSLNDNLSKEIVELIDTLKEQNKLLIGYAGNHGTANALEVLVEAMKMLESLNVALIMIGNGQEKERLINRATKLQLKNIFFIPGVPKTHIPSLLAKLDILYIGLQNVSVFKFGVSPNKLLDYMMAGKPIIYAIKARNNLVMESNCGMTIEAENILAIVKAVTELCSFSESERKKLGQNGKLFCMTHYDYRVISRLFLDILEATKQRPN